MDLGVVGFVAEGFAIAGDSFSGAAWLSAMMLARLLMRIRVVRLEADGFAKSVGGFGKFVLIVEGSCPGL